MNKEYRQLEIFALSRFEPELRALNVEKDYIITKIIWDDRFFQVRLEGDELENGKFIWKMVSSLELDACLDLK